MESTRTLISYFEDIGETPYINHELMARQFALSWARLGWKVYFATKLHAEEHEMYEPYMTAVRQLPTINPRAFEDVCYKRWLAFEVALRKLNLPAAFFADYDVMNLDLTPPEIEVKESCTFSPSQVGFWYMTLEDCRRAIHTFATYDKSWMANINGNEHISDMLILIHKKFFPLANENIFGESLVARNLGEIIGSGRLLHINGISAKSAIYTTIFGSIPALNGFAIG